MKHLTFTETTQGSTPPGDPSMFTGAVRTQPVLASSDVRSLLVTFEDGARTRWHRHSGGQVLHVVEGTGRTRTRGGEVVELAPGDLVVAEPGEEHWHGAADGTTMTHLAISIGTTEWGGAPD